MIRITLRPRLFALMADRTTLQLALGETSDGNEVHKILWMVGSIIQRIFGVEMKIVKLWRK